MNGETRRSIELNVRVNASHEAVFPLWTTVEGVRRFFADEANIVPAVGGPYEIYFNPGAEPGLKGSEGAKITVFEAGKALSFTWNAPPSLMHHRRAGFVSRVRLRFLPENGGTLVNLLNEGYPEGAEYDDVFAYFNRAWRVVLDSLNKALQA